MSELNKDIDNLLAAHSGLIFQAENSKVSGVIDIVQQEVQMSSILDSYAIEIHLPEYYPFIVFPRVFETKSKIPKEPDRHINGDGSFCLAVRPEEVRVCQSGISLLQFVDKIVVPFLAVQTAITEGIMNGFPQGEFSHGANGIAEYYQNLFKLEDQRLILAGIFLVLRNQLTRNSRCFCGSGLKTKRCHYSMLNGLYDYPKQLLRQDFLDIKSSFKK